MCGCIPILYGRTTHPRTPRRTGEAPALPQNHALHAHGKIHLGDVPCEKEHKERRKEVVKKAM